jgi:hypothetical protein
VEEAFVVLADRITGEFSSLGFSQRSLIDTKCMSVVAPLHEGPHRRFGKICFARKVVIEKAEEEI